jgi:hypothetical protein
MTMINCISRLKVLVALQKNEEAASLQQALECLGHRVELCADLNEALRWLHRWQPDLLVADETFEWKKPNSGLRLAEYCRYAKDQASSWCGTRTTIFIPVPDWDRFKRAQRTGAHVIVKGTDPEAAIRYIQTIADSLATDRMLGPVLIAMHTFRGDAPHPKCAIASGMARRSYTAVARLTCSSLHLSGPLYSTPFCSAAGDSLRTPL